MISSTSIPWTYRDVRMPELPLDNRERHPLAREFDRVGMAELMWRETTSDAGRERVAA